MDADSLRLAQTAVKDAEKASKSSWFSKPDWDIAASNWDRAAKAYSTARHYEEAVDCFTRAGDAYFKVNVLYLAAKSFENAAVCTEKHLKDHASTIKFYCRASDMFRSQGSSPDRAAGMLEKAARVCEDVDTNRAIQLYDHALTIYETDDRGRSSIPTFKKLIAYLIQKNLLLEAADVQGRLGGVCQQINSRPEVNKCNLSVIIIVLAFGDAVEAGKKLDEFGDNIAFVRSNEGTVANAMVEAYNAGDQEGFDILARDHTMTFIESAVARLAARIRVPGAQHAKPNPEAPAGSSAPAPDVDDDDDLL